MGKELNEQVETEAGAVLNGTGTAEVASSEATTETSGAPDIQAQIDAAVQEAITQYEGAGGHLAKLRSKYDTKIADLERQLRQQTKSRTDEALALMDKDPTKAAQLLAGIVQQQAEVVTQDTKRRELVAWQQYVMANLGYDLDGDEEAAALTTEWTAKILENPNETWNFHQDVTMRAVERERKARQSAEKDLQDLKGGLSDLVKAEVTRSLVGAGLVPDTSTGGDSVSANENNWREKSDNNLVSEGLRERMARATPKT